VSKPAPVSSTSAAAIFGDHEDSTQPSRPVAGGCRGRALPQALLQIHAAQMKHGNNAEDDRDDERKRETHAQHDGSECQRELLAIDPLEQCSGEISGPAGEHDARQPTTNSHENSLGDRGHHETPFARAQRSAHGKFPLAGQRSYEGQTCNVGACNQKRGTHRPQQHPEVRAHFLRGRSHRNGSRDATEVYRRLLAFRASEIARSSARPCSRLTPGLSLATTPSLALGRSARWLRKPKICPPGKREV